MTLITKSKAREIIEDFAKEIESRKVPCSKPPEEIIYFRNERRDGIPRPVFYIPIELLRFRKDNGRIASDIASYENLNGLLEEKSQKAQDIIKEFLREKDPEQTKVLTNSILHAEQERPAIITCDGFLINGNRRKLVLDDLSDEARFQSMKCVILPGKDDPGGPPTLLEIEQIENRYQLQSEGKAEYYKFDRALSIRRKIEIGMSLEEQLKDDPNFVDLPSKEFMKVVRAYEEEYLKPLECIEDYLTHFERPKLYSSISTGISDREGRWQAFLDYYNYVEKKLRNEDKKIAMGIEEGEEGIVRDVAYKIIRKREFPDFPKVHMIMRQLPKWLSNPESKKELFELKNVDTTLLKDEMFEDGVEINERKKDQKWSAKHATVLIRQIKKAKQEFDFKDERETPISLVEQSLKKLEHENLVPTAVNYEDIPRVIEVLKKIQERADELESIFWNLKKDLKKKLGIKFKLKK